MEKGQGNKHNPLSEKQATASTNGTVFQQKGAGDDEVTMNRKDWEKHNQHKIYMVKCDFIGSEKQFDFEKDSISWFVTFIYGERFFHANIAQNVDMPPMRAWEFSHIFEIDSEGECQGGYMTADHLFEDYHEALRQFKAYINMQHLGFDYSVPKENMLISEEIVDLVEYVFYDQEIEIVDWDGRTVFVSQDNEVYELRIEDVQRSEIEWSLDKIPPRSVYGISQGRYFREHKKETRCNILHI